MPSRVADLDQKKRGLQDDHDPRETEQRRNDTLKGVESVAEKIPKAHQEKTGLKGHDKSQGDLQDVGGISTPEGPKHEPKRPLDKNHGRRSG